MSEFGSRILTDPDFRSSVVRRLAERRSLLVPGSIPAVHGISVIMPTYLGRDRIRASLESLVTQDLDVSRFEVVVVLNGPDDGTADVLAEVVQATAATVRILRSPAANAGAARNVGLAAAAMAYTTFVDDDDRVEVSYLSSLLARASEDRVVVAPIRDVGPDGERLPDSTLAIRIRSLADRPEGIPLRAVPWLLGFNACKLVPTAIARQIRYESDLRSGEDVVYMARLLAWDLTVVPADQEGLSAYVRALRGDSVSRRTQDFGFAVDERIAVMARLGRVEPLAEAKPAVDALVQAQAGFVARYLEVNEEDRERVRDAVRTADVDVFPWRVVNGGQARDLAISYCFAPYLDSAGVIAAKVINDRGRIVDVISADMSGVRKRDDAVGALAAPWIDEQLIMPGPPSFNDWTLISEFARSAVRAAEELHPKKRYRTLYSRALWVGSHVASALFKLRHPEVLWTAEFSDPLGRGVDASRRSGILLDNDITAELRSAMSARGMSAATDDLSLFEFVEHVTYLLADEIVFTNPNQRDYMLGLADKKLRATAEGKSVVRPHPAPEPRAYRARSAAYEVDPSLVNVGYFGSFYGNRTLDELLIAMVNMPSRLRARLRLHVFCNKPDEFGKLVRSFGLDAYVHTNGYLDYMEFLNVTTRFDVLVVKDAETADQFAVNPFLPSKYSDYRGAGVPVWALVEPGSPLASLPTDHTSPVGDSNAALRVLQEIVTSRRAG
jgi:hypothetical protein